MTEYYVRIPFTGVLTFVVEADTPEAAQEAAFEADYRVGVTKNEDVVTMDEFELHETIVEGNVFYGCQNEIEIEEVT